MNECLTNVTPSEKINRREVNKLVGWLGERLGRRSSRDEALAVTEVVCLESPLLKRATRAPLFAVDTTTKGASPSLSPIPSSPLLAWRVVVEQQKRASGEEQASSQRGGGGGVLLDARRVGWRGLRRREEKREAQLSL